MNIITISDIEELNKDIGEILAKKSMELQVKKIEGNYELVIQFIKN